MEGGRGGVAEVEAAGLGAVETDETSEGGVGGTDGGSRPSTAGVGHTGYLVVARAP